MKYATLLLICLGLGAQAALAQIPLSAIRSADVVFVGESHDNPVHHEEQARLTAQVKPKAVVFEMLTPEAASKVTPELRGDAEALGKALDWEASGWPDFAMYYPIFAEAPEAAIYGAMVPRAETRAVFEAGPASLFGAGAAAYGLTAPLPKEQQEAREALQMEAHCDALPPEMLPGMVEVQRLRDAVLARAVVQAFEDTGGPVLVITGNGHARRDWGAPAYVARVAPDLRTISIGQGEEGRAPEGGFDMVVDAPAPERDDPCAAFQ